MNNKLLCFKKLPAITLVIFLAMLAILILDSIVRTRFSTSPTNQLNDILLLTQTQISSFDPIDAFHEGHIQIVKQIYETLTDVDEQGRCIPLLADKWETTENRIWRFYLNTNIVFSKSPALNFEIDRRFEAKDVIYSFERLLAPQSKSLGVAYFSNILGFDDFRAGKDLHLRGIREIAANIVEFELAKADSAFYCLVSIPFSSIVKQKVKEYFGENFGFKPVGTGPFTLAQYEPDQQIVLLRNTDFRIGLNSPLAPALDEIKIHLTRNENSSYASFISGMSDFLVLDFSGISRIKKEDNSSKFELASQETAKLQFYLINLKTLDNPVLRRNINAALNRQKLQEIIGESGIIAKSIFPKAIFPELAVDHSALDKIGSQPTNLGKLQNGLTKLRLVCFNDALSRGLASQVADDLQKNGYIVQVEAATFPVLVERLTRGDYDLIQIYWGPLYADPAHYLSPFLTNQVPPKGNNFNQYSNIDFDSVIESAKASTDNVIRKKLFLEAQDILLQDMPLIPLYFENLVRGSDKKFTMPLHPLLYRRYNLARLR